MVSDQKIFALNKRKDNLFRFLNIKQKQLQLQEKEKQTHDANFWNNSNKAQQTLKQISKLKAWVKTYNKVVNELDELKILIDFFHEGEASELEVEKQEKKVIAAIEDLEFKNMLSNEGDEMSAVLQITAGAGGTESCDWANMLCRMYLMWCEKRNFKTKELNIVTKHL